MAGTQVVAVRLVLFGGLTVIVKVWAGPAQGPEGVTVIVPVCVVATLAAVKFRSPEPEAGRPMAGLVLIQE